MTSENNRAYFSLFRFFRHLSVPLGPVQKATRSKDHDVMICLEHQSHKIRMYTELDIIYDGKVFSSRNAFNWMRNYHLSRGKLLYFFLVKSTWALPLKGKKMAYGNTYWLLKNKKVILIEKLKPN